MIHLSELEVNLGTKDEAWGVQVLIFVDNKVYDHVKPWF